MHLGKTEDSQSLHWGLNSYDIRIKMGDDSIMDLSSMKSYSKNLWGIALILLGSFLLIEHIWTWSEVAFWDFIGHEWLGLALVIIGTIINTNWSKDRLSEELK